MEKQKEQMKNQERRFLNQLERQEFLHKTQMEALLSAVDKTNSVAFTSLQDTTPSFVQLDPSSEIWTYLLARFCTFVSAHSVSNDRKAQIFLTNQSSTTYKLLSNLAPKQTPPKSISKLTMTKIETYMKHQFDP